MDIVRSRTNNGGGAALLQATGRLDATGACQPLDTAEDCDAFLEGAGWKEKPRPNQKYSVIVLKINS